MNTTESQEKNRKKMSGILVSTKMQKTVTVLVETKKPHPKYKKYISHSKKFHAHVPDEMECQTGDFVEIEETRPISKTKSFIVKRIIKKAEEVF